MVSFKSAISSLALPYLAAAAPTAIQSRDSNPGCQAASFGAFEWQVRDFDYHASYVFTTPAHQNSYGYASFKLANPALTYEIDCSASSSQLTDFFYGTVPYSCAAPDSASTTKTSFAFSRPSGQLDLNQTWVCSDQSPQYPVTISAYGSVNLTLECSDVTEQNPDWQIGEIYSSRTVTCGLVTVPVKPYKMTAVA